MYWYILDDAFTLYTLSVRNKYRVFHETWQLVNSFEYLLPYITIERYYERRHFIPFTNCYVLRTPCIHPVNPVHPVHPVAYIYKIVYGFLKDWTRRWNLAASWTDWFKARRIFWKLFVHLSILYKSCRFKQIIFSKYETNLKKTISYRNLGFSGLLLV